LFPDDDEEALHPGNNIEDPVIIIDSDDEWFIILKGHDSWNKYKENVLICVIAFL
jgi:hypothetical protein